MYPYRIAHFSIPPDKKKEPQFAILFKNWGSIYIG